MPQMGPLPWVSLWATTLMLLVMFLILIFYSPYYTIKMKNFVEENNQYSWKW